MRGTTRIRIAVLLGAALFASPVFAAKKKQAADETGAANAAIDPTVIQAIQALSAQDPALALRVYILAAEGAQAQYQPDQAAAIYEKALQAFPNEKDIHTRLLNLYQAQGHYDKVIELALRLAGQHSGDTSYAMIAADAYIAKGAPDQGIALLKEVAAAHPDDAAIPLQIGRALQRQGHAAEAIPFIEQAAKANPHDAGAAQSLGQAYLAVQDVGKAKGAYQQLLQAGADVATRRVAGRQMLELAKQQGALDQELATLEQQLQADPANHALHWALVDGYELAGQPGKVVATLTRARAQFPDEDEWLMRLVAAYRQQQRWNDAVTALQELAIRQHGEPGVKQELAQTLADAGRFPQAEAVYQELAAASPGNPTFLEQAAEMYARAGHYPEAIARYEKLLAAGNDEARKQGYTARLTTLGEQAAAAQLSADAASAAPSAAAPAAAAAAPPAPQAAPSQKPKKGWFR